MSPLEVENTFERRYRYFKYFVSFFFFSLLMFCAISADWRGLTVCSPFSLLLVPGYLEMLPEGGIKHGTICDCREFDSKCEIGFWLEVSQKLLLIFPMILTSIILYYFFYAEKDLYAAIVQSVIASAQFVVCIGSLIGFVIISRRMAE
ncbi:MAG TPA: hypothetical protein V6C76_09380 [Drouetiella sp.]